MQMLTPLLLLARTTFSLAMPVDFPAACSATDTGLPPALAAWTNPSDPAVMMIAPMTAEQLGGVVLPAPARPGGTADLILPIKSAKTITIAIDQHAWIDLYPKPPAGSAGVGAPLSALESVAYHQGPACSTIAKLVAFKLAAGNYVLVVSGLKRPLVKVMVLDGDRTIAGATTR